MKKEILIDDERTKELSHKIIKAFPKCTLQEAIQSMSLLLFNMMVENKSPLLFLAQEDKDSNRLTMTIKIEKEDDEIDKQLNNIIKEIDEIDDNEMNETNDGIGETDGEDESRND